MKPISLSHYIQVSSYWSRLSGVRWPLIISIAVVGGVSSWLRSEYGQDDSNLWLVMKLFLQLIQWTILGLFVFSLLSALATWVYFLIRVRSKAVVLQATFGDGIKAEAGWVPFSVVIEGPVLRPLLGTIQARLVFSGKRLSDRVILDTNLRKARQWWRQAIRGNGETLLHDRGIYDVENVLVSFCDMFALVSLPCTMPYNRQLYTLPPALEEQKINARPHTTEAQEHRTDIPKRVEGEYLNYKEFESGDNIHRIVWKIYAKSGELVVRIPEIKDPYASHLYFYMSFFTGFELTGGAFESELLNIYKDQLRNLLEALQRNGYDVRLPRDQEVPKLAGLSEKNNELFQITSASWQNKMAPSDFVSYSKAAFVCFSSLVPIQELEIILKNLSPSIPVVVVKLSDAIPSPFQIKPRDLFFKPETKPADHLRQPWLLSSLRRSLKENENKIVTTLKARGNSWLTNDIEFEQ